jgi:hypothetical protein
MGQRGAYDALVYINGSEIVAEDSNGTKIASGSVFGTVLATVYALYKNVHLSRGAYTAETDITLPAGGSLTAEPGTEITFINGTNNICLANQYTMIQGFQVNVGAILITASHTLCRDIVVSADGAVAYNLGGAFKVHVDPYTTLEDHVFENCTAIDCGRHGFLNEGDHVGSAKIIKNQRYINCQAIRCGAIATNDDWYVGFDLNECPTNIMTIQDVQLVNCHAEGCLESGFHLEQAPYVYNVQFVNCTARYNGLIKTDNLVYGSGFFVRNGCKLVNCEATGNYQGIFVARGTANNNEPVIVRGCLTKGNNANTSYNVGTPGKDQGWGLSIQEWCNNADIDVSMYQDAGLLLGGNIYNLHIRALITEAQKGYSFIHTGTNKVVYDSNIEIEDINPSGSIGSYKGSAGYLKGVQDSRLFITCLHDTGGLDDLVELLNLTRCNVILNMHSVAATGILAKIGGVFKDVTISGEFSGGLTCLQTFATPTGFSGNCTVKEATFRNSKNGVLVTNDVANIANSLIINKKTSVIEGTVTNPISDVGIKAYIMGTPCQIVFRNCKAASPIEIHAAIQDLSGTHTDVKSPDHPRCITLTQAGSGVPAAGTVTIRGVLANGDAGSEVIGMPARNALIAGSKAFAKVTSIVGFKVGAGQTLSVGMNDVFGLPSSILGRGSVYKFQKAQTDQTLPTVDVANGTVNLATITNGDDCSVWYKA